MRHYRRLRGMSQGKLADAAGIDRRYVGRIETDEVLNPEPETVKRLARALRVPMRSLGEPLGWWEDENTPEWEAAVRAEAERRGLGPEDAEALIRTARLTMGERERVAS